MAVEAAAAPSMSRATAAPLLTDDAAGAQAPAPTLTDAQGRVFQLQQDPATGHSQYLHTAEQRDQAGSRLALEILIDIAPNGSFTRRTTQDLSAANGDQQREVLRASHAADGTQLGEQLDSFTRRGSAVTTERTVGTFAAGELVRRETDLEQSDEATDEQTREVTKTGSKIHGVWDEGGMPITAATVPTIDRTDTQQYRAPGQGIHKDTDRTIDFSRHAAGPVDALDWDETGTLVVRFEGRNGRYIEREMRVPLGQADGAPDMGNAETIRTDDQQNLLNKGLMQARVWGGLASNLSWIVGLNFARGGLGKGFLALGAAASGAQLVGETHAVATKRNDGDWGRVMTSAYDALLSGMLAAYKSGRSGARAQLTPGQRIGVSAFGAAGLASNGAELASVNPIGADALTARLADAGIGAKFAQPQRTGLATDLRMEPRYDAAAALLG